MNIQYHSFINMDHPSLASPKVSIGYYPGTGWEAFSFSLFLTPETTSSILNNRHDASIAVLIIWFLTAIGYQIFITDISAIFLEFPSIPKVELPFYACLALNSVIILTTSIPQFVANVFGIIYKA